MASSSTPAASFKATPALNPDLPIPADSHIPASSARPRSCIHCRQRKIKCDRQYPCCNCIRSKLECVFPTGRGRAVKKPRTHLDSPLLNRLHRLESTIASLKRERHLNSPSTIEENIDVINSAPSPLLDQVKDSSSNAGVESPMENQLGRLMIDDTRSYYVSNILWTNLGNEIEELRDMLHESVSEDEDYPPTEVADSTTGPSPGTSGALLGFRSLAHSLKSFHPPLPQSVTLFRLFSENVVPLVHLFHMPTTRRMYWDAVVAESLDKNTEALLFAIYYSAVISMDEDQCENITGLTRTDALDKYRFAFEQALARANFLFTQSMTLLQAMVLFLSALRNEDESRTTWSLTSLAFHIAQAMGLHRDGAVFGLKPLEIELRRRLWWHICLVDIRSSEFHGYEPVARGSSFDTKPPLNINDCDINAQMKDPPPEHEGTTEMTFCLIRCEALRSGWRVAYAPPSMQALGPTKDAMSAADREAEPSLLKQRLEEGYLRYCDTSVPFMFLVSTVARLILARWWLVVHYPARDKKNAGLDETLRDKLFSTSIEVLEMSIKLFTSKAIANWTWHSKTHIQWQAVAIVLSEICSRPQSAECDRAWELVNLVHDRWNMKQPGKKGNLWRPINRLMAKARYVREMQKINLHCTVHVPNAVSAPVDSVPQAENVQSMFGMEPANSFLDLSLEGLEADMFDVPADGTWQWDESLAFNDI
ncbi:hypothetical protein N0V84_006419 [Fusarium piperis]|uniref:Zn(2)-C6 fungal-type domain-containing protein n=1 Tax=Fusarium piperis TaxID=1435070 RepID=A0A9W9BPD5_9HYPO|nr:hypothetical protein N0V84_006419 [Fusarium piperis]